MAVAAKLGTFFTTVIERLRETFSTTPAPPLLKRPQVILEDVFKLSPVSGFADIPLRLLKGAGGPL